MKKYPIYLFIILVLFSCYSGNNVPSGMIQPEKMKNILWDIMRAQTLAEEIARKDSSIDVIAETDVLSKKVFEIHKTDSSGFNKSYNWYVRHPLVLKLILDSLYAQKQRESSKENMGRPRLLHPQ